VEAFFIEIPLSNLREIHPVEAALMHVGDGQTDATELIGAFRDYAYATKEP